MVMIVDLAVVVGRYWFFFFIIIIIVIIIIAAFGFLSFMKLSAKT